MSLAILLQVMSGISIQGKLILDGRLLIPSTSPLYLVCSPHNAFILSLIISHHTPNNIKPREKFSHRWRGRWGTFYIYIHAEYIQGKENCNAQHCNAWKFHLPVVPIPRIRRGVLNIEFHQKLPAPEKCRILPPPISIPLHIFHSRYPISLSSPAPQTRAGTS
jgi:hypothetical protein